MDKGENLKLLLEELSQVYKRKTPKMYAVPSKVWYEPLKIRRQGKTGGCVPKKHHCRKCLSMVPSLSGDF